MKEFLILGRWAKAQILAQDKICRMILTKFMYYFMCEICIMREFKCQLHQAAGNAETPKLVN